MEFPPSGSFRRKKNRAHSFICVVHWLSFLSLSVSAPLSFLINLIHWSQMRLVLCSGSVCMCMWSLISSPEMPLYPSTHLYDLPFLLGQFSMLCKNPNFIVKTIFLHLIYLIFPSLFCTVNFNISFYQFQNPIMLLQNICGNGICVDLQPLFVLHIASIRVPIQNDTVSGSYFA